ncbi:FG-GAP-like repeat-containing protein [Pelagibacterium halotolerans]|uniref:FG-GAP-like repeat-containing protein n=1 Tax=Pelagibacterium halotolerans TaxID=531813 RepID=UPI00384DFA8E
MFRILVIHLLAIAFFAGAASAQDIPVDETFGADREAVRALQAQLNDLGFHTGTPDGIFGSKTEGALVSFAERFPSDIELGLTFEMGERVDQVHQGRFGNPFAPDILVAPSRIFPRETEIQTDVRADTPDCVACNVTTIVIAVGDLDADGADEIVLANHASDERFDLIDRPTRPTIVSPAADAAPRLLPGLHAEDLPARVHEREGVIADFNGDGVGDLFIAAHGFDRQPFSGEQNVLLLSGPDGHEDVSDTHLPQISDMAHGATQGDIDGDGDADILVITNHGAQNIIPYLLINDGEGRFERQDIGTVLDSALVDFRPRNRVHRAEYTTARLIDMNADGALDLLLLARGEAPADAARFSGTRHSLLLFNDGAGSFPTDTAVELPTDRWGYATFTTDADAMDIDGDGALDLVLTQSTRQPNGGTWSGQYIQILMNESGSYVDRTAERLWPQGYPGMDDLNFAMGSELADFDGDGDLDLVTRNMDPSWKDELDSAAIQIGLNDGTGHFDPVAPDWVTGFGQSWNGRNIVAGDFNGDGIDDLASFSLYGQYREQPNSTWGVVLTTLYPAR